MVLPGDAQKGDLSVMTATRGMAIRHVEDCAARASDRRRRGNHEREDATVNASPAQTSPPVRAPADDVPAGLESHRLRRRLAQVGLLVVVDAPVVALVPGLADVRNGLARASPGWLVLAAVLEVLSCLAYVVAFPRAFCSRMTTLMSAASSRLRDPCGARRARAWSRLMVHPIALGVG